MDNVLCRKPLVSPNSVQMFGNHIFQQIMLCVQNYYSVSNAMENLKFLENVFNKCLINKHISIFCKVVV